MSSSKSSASFGNFVRLLFQKRVFNDKLLQLRTLREIPKHSTRLLHSMRQLRLNWKKAMLHRDTLQPTIPKSKITKRFLVTPAKRAVQHFDGADLALGKWCYSVLSEVMAKSQWREVESRNAVRAINIILNHTE